MKIAANTFFTFRKLGEEKGLACIREAGFDGIDYTFYDPQIEEFLLHGDYIAAAQESRKRLEASGLFCRQAHAPLHYNCNDTPELSNPHYLSIVRSMEYAAILGAKIIVVHGVVPAAGEDLIDYNERFYKTLEPYCRRFGIRIGVENLFGPEAFTTPEELLGMMERLDPAWFGICLDIGHTRLGAWDEVSFIRAVGGHRIEITHIHDNDGTSDLHQVPFLGTTDWKAAAKALAETGYRGELSLEVLSFLEAFPGDLQLPALRLCAAALKKLEDLIDPPCA